MEKETATKNIMTAINFMKDKGAKLDDASFLYPLGEKIATVRAYNVDKFLIKEMYEAYKDTDVSQMFILDIEQFERFLKEMLPKWQKEDDHV